MVDRKVAEIFPPGDYIKEELEARGWTQIELAEILGRSARMVNEIICAKRGITPDTAQGLGDAFGTGAQVWLNLESAYQLSRALEHDDSVARRARLYLKAPIREMVKRGWIEPSENVHVLEKRVLDFFGLTTVDEEIHFAHAARKSKARKERTPAQNAWLFRARRLSRAVSAGNAFSQERLQDAIGRLRALLHSVEEIRNVPPILADAGIRFLIVEALPNTGIDGACFWLDANSPVIVLSLRFDRIDAFWHTLMHESGHVKNKDGFYDATLDTHLVGRGVQPSDAMPEFEKEADRFAVETLVPQDALQSFIIGVRPLYSKVRIRLFADRIHVHPGIVLGQLHQRQEIDWSSNREMLDKVRHIITKSVLTDGWGSLLPANL
ncbi:MAG: HigA family addiction module antidote protein [Chloroflexi bacterium]|nr:HigA family addiction module antidote protein [Chloroflexota bacterium]